MHHRLNQIISDYFITQKIRNRPLLLLTNPGKLIHKFERKSSNLLEITGKQIHQNSWVPVFSFNTETDFWKTNPEFVKCYFSTECSVLDEFSIWTSQTLNFGQLNGFLTYRILEILDRFGRIPVYNLNTSKSVLGKEYL